MTELTYTEQGWRNTVDTSRHHRENLWDYKGRAIYHITLCVEQRYHLFGEIKGDSPEEAHVEKSEMGRYVDTTFRHLPDFYRPKGIALKILAVQVMPDHLHGVIQVLEPMPKSIGEVIRSFKSACTSWYKNALNSERPQECGQDAQKIMHFSRIFAAGGSIWEKMPAGYHERILHAEGQLDRMIQYDKENPRRRWLKMAHPELFTMRHDLHYRFTDTEGKEHDWVFRAMGNMFLWDWPQKQYIQCSRSATAAQIEERKQKCLRNAQEGKVSVTATISPGEKDITKAVREAGYPLIILLKDGFPPEGSESEKYYSPGGIYHQLCAKGQLLLLEPHMSLLSDQGVADAVYRKDPWAKPGGLRYHFLSLNHVAMTMAEYRE